MRSILALTAMLLAVGTAAGSVYVSTTPDLAGRLAGPMPCWVLAVAAPVVVMVLYGVGMGVWLWRIGRPAALASLAAELYFIGYLCTITTLVTLIFRYSVEGTGFPGTAIIMRAVAVGLTTTLVGLLLMNVLRNWAETLGGDDLEGGGPSGSVAPADTRKLQEAVDAAASELAASGRRISEVEKELQALSRRLTEASQALQVFVTGTTNLQRVLEKLESTDLTPDKLERLGQALSAMERFGRSAQSLGLAAQTTEGRLTGLSKALGGAEAQAGALAGSMGSASTPAAEFAHSVEEAQQVLDSFVALVQRHVGNGSLGSRGQYVPADR